MIHSTVVMTLALAPCLIWIVVLYSTQEDGGAESGMLPVPQQLDLSCGRHVGGPGAHCQDRHRPWRVPRMAGYRE